jgi:hypothetical protein
MAERVTGRCLCGGVTFESDAAPIAVRACWCRDCQYLAAGNATVNAIFRAEGFRTTGPVREYASTADSGNGMRRGFCPDCGTPLFSRASDRPHLVVVRVGALDDAARYAPQGTIWTRSAPDWAHIPESPMNCEAQPAPVPR